MRKIALAAAAASVVGFIAFVATTFAATSLRVSPTSLTFDGVALGTTSAPQTVTIKNRSGAAVYIGGFRLSSGFHVIDDTCSGADLAADATCTIGVTFTAAGSGTVDGELSVATTPPPNPLPINGEGGFNVTPFPFMGRGTGG